ncbi:MAG: hypothetical protein Q8903_00285 [Bacteroidota bacterium]|nr:hypothetical protein [Bacteroidota bacterium]
MATREYKQYVVAEAQRKIQFIKDNINYLVKSENSDNMVTEFFTIYDYYKKHHRLNKRNCEKITVIYIVTMKVYENNNMREDMNINGYKNMRGRNRHSA